MALGAFYPVAEGTWRGAGLHNPNVLAASARAASLLTVTIETARRTGLCRYGWGTCPGRQPV
jgi:hypothetical protein